MERVTTAEAARRLQLSATQVRRLVAAGRLVAETEDRPQGKRILILWDHPDAPTCGHQDATQDAPGTSPDAPTTPQDATQDATHTHHLEDEIAWLRSRLEAAERERGELRELLAREQATVQRLRLIEAPSMAENTPPRERAPQRAPWWRWWPIVRRTA